MTPHPFPPGPSTRSRALAMLLLVAIAGCGEDKPEEKPNTPPTVETVSTSQIEAWPRARSSWA